MITRQGARENSLPRRQRRRNVCDAQLAQVECTRVLADIKPHFKKTRDSRIGILRPYKRLVADILVSEACVDASIAAADALFRALAKRGHHVTIAPHAGCPDDRCVLR